MFDFFKTNNTVVDTHIPIEDVTPEKIVDANEWIWVEGYKGFYKKVINGKVELCGQGDYVYSLTEPNSIEAGTEGNMSVCHHGLHFSPDLKSAFIYYTPIAKYEVKYDNFYMGGFLPREVYYNTVFFKVKAEVKKSDWDQKSDKYVARTIILEKEIPYEEVYDAYPEKCQINGKQMDKEEYVCFKKMFDTAYSAPDIKSVSDAYYVLIKDFEDKKRFKQIDHLVSLGYCETFANIVVDKNKYDEAVTYAEEGLSKDMRAYLLMK